MKTSTMLLLGAGAYVAYMLWKKQQAAATGTSTAAVTGPAQSGAAVSGPAVSEVESGYDDADYVPAGWGPMWTSIMPGGRRRMGGGGPRRRR